MREMRDAFDIEMPLLHDPQNDLLRQYQEAMAFPTGAYPHHFVIGRDGTVIYSNNRYDADALNAVLQAELD
jgi:peroxiredoxin